MLLCVYHAQVPMFPIKIKYTIFDIYIMPDFLTFRFKSSRTRSDLSNLLTY